MQPHREKAADGLLGTYSIFWLDERIVHSDNMDAIVLNTVMNGQRLPNRSTCGHVEEHTHCGRPGKHC